MKKLIAITLALTLAFTLAAAGCRKTETQEETTTVASEITTSTETTQSQEEENETTISPELFKIYEEVRKTKLMAEKADFEMLECVVRNISLINLSRDFYDSTSELAFQDAMYMIYNSGVHLGFGLYGKESSFEWFQRYDSKAENYASEPDPLNRFAGEEDCLGYVRIDAEYVDWVLENVLDVTPDRTKSSEDFDYSSYPNAREYYYYDGYYYYSMTDGGGGGEHLKTIGFVCNLDGSYTVRFTTFDREYEDGYDNVGDMTHYGYSIIEATASLENVDGERVWKITYTGDVEYIEQERFFF